jgi:hypothetical protein
MAVQIVAWSASLRAARTRQRLGVVRLKAKRPRGTHMDRQHKIATLLAHQADDARRLALDELDRHARQSNTFGSREHRSGRDEAERTHDNARRRYEALPEQELDAELSRLA